MKRYNCSYGDGSVFQCKNGDYVLYEDAATIERERDAWKARAKRAEANEITLVDYAPPGHPDHCCGGPEKACMQPGCSECGCPTMVAQIDAALKEVGEC